MCGALARSCATVESSLAADAAESCITCDPAGDVARAAERRASAAALRSAAVGIVAESATAAFGLERIAAAVASAACTAAEGTAVVTGTASSKCGGLPTHSLAGRLLVDDCRIDGRLGARAGATTAFALGGSDSVVLSGAQDS